MLISYSKNVLFSGLKLFRVNYSVCTKCSKTFLHKITITCAQRHHAAVLVVAVVANSLKLSSPAHNVTCSCHNRGQCNTGCSSNRHHLSTTSPCGCLNCGRSILRTWKFERVDGVRWRLVWWRLVRWRLVWWRRIFIFRADSYKHYNMC